MTDKRTHVLHRRADFRRCKLCDGLVKALPQPSDSRRRAVQVEDRSADLLNDVLEIVDTARKSLLHFGRARSGNRPLKREPDGEEALDDVIVQIAGDAVAVCQDAHLAHLALRAGQLPRQRRLVGEGGHHVELVGAERRRAGGPQGDQNPGDGVGRPQGQHERRAGDRRVAGDQREAVETPGGR